MNTPTWQRKSVSTITVGRWIKRYHVGLERDGKIQFREFWDYPWQDSYTDAELDGVSREIPETALV